MEQRKNAADAFLEYAYLFLVGLVTLMAFRETTMLTLGHLQWDPALIRWLRAGPAAAAAVVVLLRVIRGGAWRVWDAVAAAAVCGALAASWLCVRRSYVLELAALMAGAHGIEFRRIARVHVAVTAAALAATVALALTGVIENLVYYREGHVRMALGAIYPTDFAAHVFFLAAGWAWLRAGRVSWAELAAMAGLGVFCLICCDARNSTLCLLLLAAGLSYVKLRRRLAERRGGTYTPHPAAQWALCLSMPALAALMLALTALYDPDVGWMSALDGLLSGRLHLGHEGLAQYPLTAFGYNVYMKGLGGAVLSAESAEGYFFLDSSYVNALLRFGAATFVCVTAYMTGACLRERRNGAWLALVILAAVAVHCAFEHHLLELTYNIFLLLPPALSGGSLTGGSTAAQPEAPR